MDDTGGKQIDSFKVDDVQRVQSLDVVVSLCITGIGFLTLWRTVFQAIIDDEAEEDLVVKEKLVGTLFHRVHCKH